MKRFVAVLSGLLVMPAFAEVAPIYYDEVIEYSETENVGQDVVVDDVSDETAVVNTPVAPAVSARVTGRSASRASRSVPVITGAVSTRSGTGASRAVASRVATTRSATSDVSRVRDTMTRSAAVRSATAARSARPTATTRSVTSSSERNVSARYAEPAANVARVGVRTRAPAVRAAAATLVSSAEPVTVDAAEATTSMEELVQLTDFCKAQYMECMDNYCNVLDDAQGRCSCSKNIKNYAKTEEALKVATESLQDIAQKIQYIGLSADEINTLFEQTAAEVAMQSTTDSSQLKTDLDKIKNMIVGVKSGTASSSEISSGVSMDLSGLLNFNVDSVGFDLTGLFGGASTAKTNSISNQRGEELYKTAAARCKTAILNTCQAQGVDIAVVTNSYDLEIDKQCVAYERTLVDENDRMRATVRNAQSVLQKARLMVAQEKNAYDLRGCVNALDSCMQDDFVCGTDYENCLDPLGKYIVNGEIVIGSTPGQSVNNNTVGAPAECPDTQLYAAWNYSDGKANAWCGDGSLNAYINATLKSELPEETSDIMTGFLANKIGYIKDGRTYGMCASILNKCQDYTYVDGEYQPDNPVVKEYLRRTLTQIKVVQDQVIADHAENCIAEVSSCLSQNGYTTNRNIAINSCRAAIKTCMSVNGDATAGQYGSVEEWVEHMLGVSVTGVLVCPSGQYFVYKDGSSVYGTCRTVNEMCDNGTKWYNAGTYRCEYRNGEIKDGVAKCTLAGLTSQSYDDSTNTCSCPDGKIFKKIDDVSSVAYGKGSCE